MGQAGDYHLSVSRRLYSLDLSMEAVSPARSARQGRKPQLQSVKLVPSVKRSRILPDWKAVSPQSDIHPRTRVELTLLGR
jgi:hypothetical protein